MIPLFHPQKTKTLGTPPSRDHNAERVRHPQAKRTLYRKTEAEKRKQRTDAEQRHQELTDYSLNFGILLFNADRGRKFMSDPPLVAPPHGAVRTNCQLLKSLSNSRDTVLEGHTDPPSHNKKREAKPPFFIEKFITLIRSISATNEPQVQSPIARTVGSRRRHVVT